MRREKSNRPNGQTSFQGGLEKNGKERNVDATKKFALEAKSLQS